jgi:HK97 family phage prohead protease
MAPLQRSWAGSVVVRAGTTPDERIVEGIVVPFGQRTRVQDAPGGQPYYETIARGATTEVDPEQVRLEYLPEQPEQGYNNHRGARLIGRGVAGQATDAGHHMAFRIARTPAGDEGYELAREGVLTDFSVVMQPLAERRLQDGTIERTAIAIRRVALVERAAYQGAQVTAVRAAQEGTMPGNTQAAAPAENTEETTEEQEGQQAAATPAPAGDRPNRTRVTVDVERAQEQARAAAEQATAGELARSSGIRITRPEAVYGPNASEYFLRDAYRASRGDWEAQQRQQRHQQGVLEPAAAAIERAAAWDWASGELNRSAIVQRIRQLERAGDVLSSEIPGAYPTDFVPGLLTPRILKGRPMGDFYDRFPIADARVRTFPKVTTSTAVAVQSAEGAALSSTDFATTAVSATPLMYGAYTDVSRQTIDGADPVAQAMLLQDLNEAYAQASETVIKTAVEAGSTASGVAITAATPYAGTLANVINYYAVRFKSANGAFIPSALFPVLAAQGDTTGRPFLPMIGAVNSDGSTLADDLTLDLAVLTARTKLSYASTVNVCVFGRPTDFVTFESSVASFSFDQVVGPQAVRIGIWAYLVVGARLGSLKVTAA